MQAPSRLVQENDLFGTCTEEELSALMSEFHTVQAEANAVLFTEGHVASHLYIVTDGGVALQRTIRPPLDTRPRRVTVVECEPGDAFGWSALVDPFIYTLSAVTWKPSTLLSIEAGVLRHTLNSYPALGYKVMQALSALISRRLRQTADALITVLGEPMSDV